jgi:hypothetical protein
LDQIDNQNHNRNNEQDMNESTQGVGADQSKQPEHKQDHKYCPEHMNSFRLSFTFIFLRAGECGCAYRAKKILTAILYNLQQFA